MDCSKGSHYLSYCTYFGPVPVIDASLSHVTLWEKPELEWWNKMTLGSPKPGIIYLHDRTTIVHFTVAGDTELPQTDS